MLVTIRRPPYSSIIKACLSLCVGVVSISLTACSGLVSSSNTTNSSPVAPTITTQPVNQTVTAGQTATFTVTATGTAPLSYQWQKNGANISGATSASYTTPATTTSDSGSKFDVVVSNSAGSVTSSSAALTVSASAVAPSITTQPVNQTVTAGQTATFTVVASGTAPLSYQWQKNGANISGATSASYMTPATTSSDSGSTFKVVVGNSAGTATSNSATLTVSADTVAPTVPTGLTATAASSTQINLTWTASTDNVGVTGYNIFRGGAQVGTSATTAFSDSGLAAATSYSYTVAAFDGAGNSSAQSAAATGTTLSGSGGGGIPSGLGWYAIPNTQLSTVCPTYTDIQGNEGCSAVMADWSGGLFDSKRNRFIIHGGGHTGWYGNEIYAVDLNANPIGLVLVKDASHGTAISNLSTCPETFSDGTPNARHTYNGLQYLPQQDAYFLYGAGLSPCGNFSDGLWTFSPNTLNWTQHTTATHPNSAQNGSVPQFAYDPVSAKIYEVEANTGTFWSYDPAGNTWASLASVSACGLLNMTTAIDSGRELYFCVGNGGFNKVSLVAPYAATTLTGTGCAGLISATGPGFSYDPVQKLMVGWTGGNSAYLYNPDTDSCSTVTYTGGPGSAQGNGTYGRFQYAPALGVFVVANSISEDVYSLRLTNPVTTAQQDFQTRCAAPGVIVCDAFDNATEMPQRTCADSDSGLYKDCFDSSSTYMTVDTSTYRSGGGSMEATIPATPGGASNPQGYWRRLFTSSLNTVPGTNDANLTVFGPNTDLYISYAQRMDSPYITSNWTTPGGVATYWKQQIISWSGSTCGGEEITTVNDFNEGYPLTYSNCGATPFQLTVNGTLYNEFTQFLITGSGATGYNCAYGSAQPNANCFDYPVNVWVTYTYHVHIGTWGSANSLVEGWVSTPSNPSYKQWLYMNNLTLTQDPGSSGFDMVTLLAYWTGGISGTYPAAHTWYDELIVSSQPIAAPQTLPAAP